MGNESLPMKINSTTFHFICRKEKNAQTGNISESFTEDCAKNIIIQVSFQDSSRSHEQDIITKQLYILFFCIAKILFAGSAAVLKYFSIIINILFHL